jgi:hypothetical protein
MSDGWTIWEGGKCPCAGQAADVMFRNGDVSRACIQMPRAEGWSWRHRGHGSDIIAYRIAERPHGK